jgi:flavin reductase (DIM6/NTAB) family NADH-FMN oxidoreductase RutF
MAGAAVTPRDFPGGEMTGTSLNRSELRRAFGCFVTGVTIVTTLGDGEPRGFTANSFTSVSLDPPLLLVCVAKSAGSYDIFRRAPSFAVNILHRDQREISATFASPRDDKFSGHRWMAGETGSPLLTECAAWFDCSSHDQIEAGDHMILIGRVLAFSHTPLTPLGYHRGGYLGLSAECAADAER